jgi:hypothetical protein
MARLKPSEFRLVLIFSILGFVLINFYGYTRLQKQHNDVRNERIELKSKLLQAENYALQEEDSVRKEAWLAKRVPVYQTEADMKSFLIKFVRQKAASFGIEAELHSQEPVREGGYMRSRLEVKQVSGTVDTLVQWIFSLQDPEEFRMITSLELKAKPKDPTTVFCELVIEQWWNPESLAIVASSGIAPAAPATAGVESPPELSPPELPAPTPDAPEAGGVPGVVVPDDAPEPVVKPEMKPDDAARNVVLPPPLPAEAKTDSDKEI